MSTHILDHIVHLTPPGSVEDISAEYRSLGFDVLPGGQHADGLTYNALVALADGVYLELIAFVRPHPPPAHWWGAAPPGWIDIANLARGPDVSSVINERAARDGSGVAYRPPRAGGRQTPDGRTLQWRVAFPEAAHGSGRLPFFCEDLTPREWRVPKPGNHPCTARGISHITLLAMDSDEFATLSAQVTTVLGTPPSSSTQASATWPLDTPAPHPGLEARLILKIATSDDGDIAPASKRSGIYEVGFFVDKDRGGQSAQTSYGKIVWTPVP